MKKYLSLLLVVIMLISVICSAPVSVSAANGIDDRINSLLNLFPNGSYFSVDGKACRHESWNKCSNCSLTNIVTRSDLSSLGYKKDVDFIESQTCIAFSRFAFRYIFGKMLYESNYTQIASGEFSQSTFAYAKKGDIIEFRNSSGDTKHAAVFIGNANSSNATFYHANFQGTPKVSYGSWTYADMKKSYGENGTIKVLRANNYDQVSGEPPTVPTPTNVWIQASDDLISPGESVTFTFGADNATGFTIGIDKDGTRIITEHVSSSKSYTFEEEGTYAAYVTASGPGGNIDSQKIFFSVYQIEDLGHSFYAEITRTWGNTALTDDNRNLALYTNTHSENQLWKFTRQSDGSYMIYNVASRGYIDLASSSATNNTNVQVIIRHDVNAQHWYIIKTDVGYSLATKCGIDWRLDVADNGTADGTNLQVYKFHNHNAQKFYINKVDKVTLNTNETEEDVLVLPIHNVNGNREIGYNVIYTNEFGAETNTNKYGAEKAFDLNGKLVETREYGVDAKLTIPTYGFVFSMSSRSANIDTAMSEEYQYAYYDCENNNIELFKNESDYQQRKLKHLIGSKSFFKDDVYILQATNVDELRGVGATVIYTSNYGVNTATNMYGNEVSFDSEGKLVGTRDWGNTTPLDIPSRGFAISEHSSGIGYKTILSENYQYGYCNFEQKVVVLFKNKEDYEMGKRLFCAQNQNYGELPVPVRDGYTFDGWYTQSEGGQKVDSSTLFTGDKELFAHWIPNSTIILGDTDGDGKVTIKDATTIQKHVAGITTISDEKFACADTDKDGKISVKDATRIQKFLAGIISSL